MVIKMNVFKKISYWTAAGGVLAVSLFLLAQGFFTEVKTGQGPAEFYIVSSNKILILAGFLLLLAVCYFFHKYGKLSDKIVERLIIIMCVINTLFVLSSQNMPRADQQRVIECASEIVQGNYRAYAVGNYLYMCPHQNGIVLFCYCLCRLFGENNFLMFQFANVLAVNYTYYFVYQFLKKYKPESRRDETMAGIFLFFPITLFTNYVYGFSIGVMCAVCSILYQQMYFKDRNRKHLLLSILFIALAYCMKTNYLVFAIGIILLYFMDVLIKRRYQSIFGMAGIALGLFLAQCAVNGSLAVITEGASKGVKGVPDTAYIAMGIGTGGGTGWFNGSNWAFYSNNDYDYEKAKEAGIEKIKDELADKLAYPDKAAAFFREKAVSMWLETSHGAFSGNRIDYKTVLWNHSHLYNDIFSYTGRLHRILSLFLEIYQSAVYFGVILYLIFTRKNNDVTRLSGLIVFLGGFLFHLFWEAHSSYSFIYFVLLIPYAAAGLDKCFEKTDSAFQNFRENKNLFTLLSKFLPFLAGFLILVGAGSVLAIGKDNESWEAFFREHRFIDEGCYYLKSAESGERCGFDESGRLFLSIDMSDAWQYEFCDLEKEKKLTVTEEGIRLVSWEGEAEGQNVFSARWRIERKGGAYCIRWWQDMNKVMTYDIENHSVCLTDYEEGNRSQLWELER